MIIKYARSDDRFPLLRRVKPVVSDSERKLARLPRPPALPSHCKPWLDANSYGLLMVFPYEINLSITGEERGYPTVTVNGSPRREAHKHVLSFFSSQHFGLSTGYRFRTDPGIGLFMDFLPQGYPQNGRLIRGLIETWWYPKSLFLVFQVPEPGETITFEHSDPLCVVMPVLCERVMVQEMSSDELDQTIGEQGDYEEYYRRHPEHTWTSMEGVTFSSAYKHLSKQHAQT